MNELFKKYDIELSQEENKKFEKFLNIFMEKNSQINLSSIRDTEWIIEKHFIDSILINAFYKVDWKILDLGTWWGFPWIPLKIVDDNNSDFTLLDSVSKKLKVVDYFIQELWLTNIQTLNWRAEELWKNPTYREKFDFVVSRATAYLPTLLEYSIPFLKIWWIFISYKLDNPEEIEKAQKALDTLDCEIIKEIPYEISWQKRIYLFIQKVGPTPKKYPRQNWERLKNPII